MSFLPVEGSVCHQERSACLVVDPVRETNRESHPTCNTDSRLLALPAEIRNAIYEYTLSEPYGLGIGGSYNTSRTAPKVFGGDAIKSAKQPPITYVSRQLRRETLPLFYQLNRFVLALHYRRARAEVERWLHIIVSQPAVSVNIWRVTIKHRFGILDFRGTVDFDMRVARILGPRLWFNAIPPLIAKEVRTIVESARTSGPSEVPIVQTLRQLVEILGVDLGASSLSVA